ncbi:MAG: hypothetical protein ABIR96_09665, partial [Bdellovibrionota bacterium]
MNFCISFCCFFILASCATSGLSSQSLRFKDAVTVTTGGGRESSYKADESIPMPSEPVQVEAPGHVSVLVVPLKSASGVTEIQMRRLETWSGSEMGRELNQRLNKVTGRVVEIQRALAKRSGRDALRMIEELESSYPELTYLNFLKASSYVLNGERDKARAA